MYGPVGKVYISNPIYWRKVKVKRASSVTQLLKLSFQFYAFQIVHQKKNLRPQNELITIRRILTSFIPQPTNINKLH
jgi:hypothetical protein